MENTANLDSVRVSRALRPRFTNQPALDISFCPGRNNRSRSLANQLARGIHDDHPLGVPR